MLAIWLLYPGRGTAVIDPFTLSPLNGTAGGGGGAPGKPLKKSRLSAPKLAPVTVTVPSALGVTALIAGGSLCASTNPYGNTYMSLPKLKRICRGPPLTTNVARSKAKAVGEPYGRMVALEKPGTMTDC